VPPHASVTLGLAGATVVQPRHATPRQRLPRYECPTQRVQACHCAARGWRADPAARALIDRNRHECPHGGLSPPYYIAGVIAHDGIDRRRIEGKMWRWMGRHGATMETCCGRGHLF
jgi:hypothetical protein